MPDQPIPPAFSLDELRVPQLIDIIHQLYAEYEVFEQGDIDFVSQLSAGPDFTDSQRAIVKRWTDWKASIHRQTGAKVFRIMERSTDDQPTPAN